MNPNNFVAAYCEIDTISRLHHLLEVIDEMNFLILKVEKIIDIFNSL